MSRIPIMEDLITGPVPAGSNILVEYDSASQWYAASYAIAAGWLKTGGRVSYCIAIRPPDDFRSQLGKFGLEAQELERDEKLMIYDWYTATLGQKSTEKHRVDSLKVNDLNLYFSKEWMRIPSSPDLLRVTDNISCLDRFNDEKNWVEIFLSRAIPSTSRANSTTIRGIVNGVHSDWAYKTLEASVDGIIDFKLDETTDPARNLIRIRNMRNVGFDGRWHPLKVGENFEVTIER